LAKVEKAEQDLSSQKTAKTKAVTTEKELVSGIFVTATDVHPESIVKAELVGHQIWAVTNKGTVVVVDADVRYPSDFALLCSCLNICLLALSQNGKVIDKFERLFEYEDVIDLAVDGQILWVATKTTVKYILTVRIVPCGAFLSSLLSKFFFLLLSPTELLLDTLSWLAL